MSTQIWQAYTIDEAALTVLHTLVKEDGLSAGGVCKGGCVEALARLSHPSLPSCLLVSLHSEHEMSHALKMLATQCAQLDIKLLVLGQVGQMLSFEMLRRVGVSAYLPAPFSAKALRAAIQSVSNAKPTEEARIHETQIFTCVGSYPGVGVSTVCANLAACMATKQETLLIDLDPIGGGLWPQFGDPTVRGLYDMLAEPQRIDTQLYQATRVALGKQLYGLGDQLPLDAQAAFSGAGLQQCLSFLYGQIPVIFLDVPYHHAHLLTYLMPYTRSLMIVVDETNRTLAQLARLLPLLESLPLSQWQLWVNQPNKASAVDLDTLLEKMPGVTHRTLPYLGGKMQAVQAEESEPFSMVYPMHRWSRVCQQPMQDGCGTGRPFQAQMKAWLQRLTRRDHARSGD